MIGRGVAQAAVRAFDGMRSRVALREATRVGDDVRVFGWPRVANEGELVIGGGVALVSSPSPVELLVAAGGSLIIGDAALIESGVAIRARGRIRIGSGARIGAGCIVDDDGPGTNEISVADGAWIEDGVVLLAGAHVAAGSILERRVISSAPPGLLPASSRSSPPPYSGEDGAMALDVDRRMRAVLARLIIGAGNVHRNASLTELKGWDSLAALRVLVGFEKEFGVVLPHQLFGQEPTIESITPVILASITKRAEAG
jgi:acyl carrier protein/acetyltransferase-like isoleucine patch superfamily enzyme